MPPPAAPYYVAIFTSKRSAADADGYGTMADRMMEMAAEQPGYLGVDSVRSADGVGITLSYWRTLEELHAWGRVPAHLEAQRLGRDRWYESYDLRIAKVD